MRLIEVHRGAKRLSGKLLPSSYSFRLVVHERAKAAKPVRAVAIGEDVQSEVEAVDDQGKRTFLKALGIAGLGLVGASLIPSKANALVLGGAPATSVVGMKDSSNNRVNPATEDSLAAVKTQTNKLTFDGTNNLYVQAATNFASQLENASSVVINPATEDTLALIKAQTAKLSFDASNNLQTVSTGGGAVTGIVGIKDTTSTQINPASDDSLVYLRRMVKLMESQAAVDSGNRQRVTIDSPTNANGILVAQATAANLNATVMTDGQGRQQFTEIARQAYNSGIRSSLIFS